MISRATNNLNISILLLASDPVVRKVIQEILESEGYQVIGAATLGAAVDTLRDCRPDLLITRTYVDNMPGHEAALYLRKKYPGLRVLMLSGYPIDDRLTIRATLNGFDVFPGPYPAAQLLTKVKEVLSAAVS